MPRLKLTEKEMALIAETRKQTALVVQGLEEALALMSEIVSDSQGDEATIDCYNALAKRITAAIKERQ